MDEWTQIKDRNRNENKGLGVTINEDEIRENQLCQQSSVQK